MFLYGTYPHKHSRLGKAAGRPPLLRGRKGHIERQRGLVQSLYNYHLGDSWHGETGVALGNPSYSSPGWGAQGLLWLLPPALSMGSEVLFFTVVLSWGQPKTLPGWHMLVGEERTEG